MNETPCACVLELSCVASLPAGARRCLRSKGKLCYIRQVAVRHSQATAPSLGLDLLTSRLSGIGGALYALLHSLYAHCPRYQRCASRIVCLCNPLVTTIRHAYPLLVVAQADVYLAAQLHASSARCYWYLTVPSKLMQRKLRRSETRRKLMGSRAARSLLGPLVDGYRDLEPAKQTLSRPGVNFLCLDCNLLLLFPSLHLTLRSIQANAAASDKHAALQYIRMAVNSCFCCRQQRGKHGQGRSGRRWILVVEEVAPRLQKSSSQ